MGKWRTRDLRTIMEEEVFKKGTCNRERTTKDLRRDNRRRGTKRDTRMGNIPEMGQWRQGDTKGTVEKKSYYYRKGQEKMEAYSRKGHRRRGDYGRGREKVDER
jgi:hypothetical protein